MNEIEENLNFIVCYWFWTQRTLLTYEHEVLINLLVKLAQEQSVVRWTDRPDMTGVSLTFLASRDQGKVGGWFDSICL